MEVIFRRRIYKTVNVSDLKADDILVNLGEVLEIDELPNSFVVVVFRMNEKQVFRFMKDQEMLIHINDFKI